MSNIIGDLHESVNTGNKPRVIYREILGYVCYTSTLEPKNVKEALEDDKWIAAIQEELGQFERGEVWDLVPRLSHVNIIEQNGSLRTKPMGKVISQGTKQDW